MFLSVWQVYRWQWKLDIIDNINTQRSLPTLDSRHLDAIDDSLLFRHLYIQGTIDREHIFFFIARSPSGTPGFRLFAPLRTELPKQPHILIDLGWINPKLKNSPSIQDYLPTNKTRLRIQVRPLPTYNYLTRLVLPQNDPTKNSWIYYDTSLLAQQANISSLPKAWYGVVLAPEWDFTLNDPPFMNIPNNHVQYAITWFLLAISAVFVWFFKSRITSNENNESTL